MLTISAASSIEYWVECTANERGHMQYYLDSTGEPPGTWYSPSNWLAADGATVAPADLRQVAAGFDPAGGRRLVQSNVKKRRAAYDLTFSAPKSVSTLWAVGNNKQRALIEAAHAAAVRAALDKIGALQLIETRRGKAGVIKEATDDLLAAIYDHHSTRAGDPQIHTHVLLMNLCMRSDGTTGSIDNSKLMPLLKSIGAFYRSSLAQNLIEEGFTIEQRDYDFKIAGVPETLIETWSKRRKAIEGAAAQAGLTTGEDRQYAEMLNKKTRTSKSKLPTRAEMEENWRSELSDLQFGLTGDQIWRDALIRPEAEAIEQPTPDQQAASCVAAAIAELIETESVIEYRMILERALVKSQGRCLPDLIWPAVEAAETDGLIVRLNPNDEAAPPVFSTPEIIAAEKSIVEIAQRRKDERLFVSPHVVDRAIRATNRGDFKLSAEQEAAVKHALGRDAVACVWGSAGTGKSSVFAAIHDAAADSGADIHLLAPSWKATTGAAKELSRMRKEQARAMAGFLAKFESGKIKLSRQSLILVDEAGMISTKDMHRLLKAADAAGAKIVLAGDDQQLSAVQAGSPLSLLTTKIGAARIHKIIRQKEPWMAEASMFFASGKTDKIKEAVTEYADRGHFTMWEDREAAMTALAEAWLESVKAGDQIGVIAARNDDVAALNERIRARAVEAGLIKGAAIEVEAVGRGKIAKAAPLTIQAGDRLLLGEGLRLAGRDVANNSVLVVLAVDLGPPARLTVRLEDGTVISIRPAELTGPRGRAVRLQHGFAGTIHSSQGATYDRTLIYDATNMKSRAAYVAMTRHRQDVRVFVNGEAIKQRRAVKPADRVIMAGAGGVAGFADEEEDVPNNDELTDTDMIKILAATWSATDKKLNASDFLPTPAAKEPEPDEADQDDDAHDYQPRRSQVACPIPQGAMPPHIDRPRP
jgi:conjugative relaxase-like TrwC/TraI family protein